MQTYSKPPHSWWEFRMRPNYYLTYWGDIYFGTIFECPNYDDGFFIIPNHNLKEHNDLKAEQKSPEILRDLGWEINDHRVIKKIYRYNRGERIFTDEKQPTIWKQDQQFKKMFVFGAGASTFCCFNDAAESFKADKLHPPIGYEIFHERYDDICEKYPAVKYSIPEFESKGNNIEECLEEEWLKYRSHYNPMIAVRHINIQFYLRDLFLSISRNVCSRFFRKNLYSLFTNRLQKYCASHGKQRPILVSFNYDTILEKFVADAFGSPYEHLDDYIDWKNRSVIIFKPHGSANWGWKFSPQFMHSLSGKNISETLYNNKTEPVQIYYEYLGPLSEMVYESGYGVEQANLGGKLGRYTLNKQKISLVPEGAEQNYLPALLLPYRDKDEFVMPYHHQVALENWGDEAEQLFLIGWKGNEDVFNRKMKTHFHGLKELIIVNPEPKAVEKNLAPYLDLSKLEVKHIASFEDFVLKHLDDYLK